MVWAQINLTTHVSWLPTIYLTQKGKRKERRPLSTVWYPWESTKQFVKSLHWTLIRKCGVNKRLKQCELGGYWAMQIWRGVGQTMATSERMFSHRKFSLSRALKDGTREVQSRTRVKEPERCISGSFSTRNTAETPNSHQIPPWLLDGLPSWNRGEVRSPGLIKDLDSSPIHSGDPRLLCWNSRLVNVALAGRLHVFPNSLNFKAIVVIL